MKSLTELKKQQSLWKMMFKTHRGFIGMVYCVMAGALGTWFYINNSKISYFPSEFDEIIISNPISHVPPRMQKLRHGLETQEMNVLHDTHPAKSMLKSVFEEMEKIRSATSLTENDILLAQQNLDKLAHQLINNSDKPNLLLMYGFPSSQLHHMQCVVKPKFKQGKARILVNSQGVFLFSEQEYQRLPNLLKDKDKIEFQKWIADHQLWNETINLNAEELEPYLKYWYSNNLEPDEKETFTWWFEKPKVKRTPMMRWWIDEKLIAELNVERYGFTLNRDDAVYTQENKNTSKRRKKPNNQHHQPTDLHHWFKLSSANSNKLSWRESTWSLKKLSKEKICSIQASVADEPSIYNSQSVLHAREMFDMLLDIKKD